jgi:hypothetical protein
MPPSGDIHGPTGAGREYIVQVVHRQGANSWFEQQLEGGQLPTPIKQYGAGILYFSPPSHNEMLKTEPKSKTVLRVEQKPVALLRHLIWMCAKRACA